MFAFFMEHLQIMHQLTDQYQHMQLLVKQTKVGSLTKPIGKKRENSYGQSFKTFSPTCLRNRFTEELLPTHPNRENQNQYDKLGDKVGNSFFTKGVKITKNRKNDSTSRIEKYYKQVISFDLLLQCGLKKSRELFSSTKIVLNSSSKKINLDKKELLIGLSALFMISGQKSQVTWARKSIAAFKLREGGVLGCKVTLRGKRFYSFLDKLINIILPGARRSVVNQTIDFNGNYAIGISDPFVFIELEHHYDLFQSLQGIDVALIIPGGNKQASPLLWSGLQLVIEL